MKNISTKLRIGFSLIVLTLMAATIGTANPDRIGTMPRTDDILRSRAAFAVVEEEIAHHLNLGVLTAWDSQKLHGPVLLEIRTEIHFQLRQAFGRIVNTVDFGTQLNSGSPSHSPSTPQVNKPVLHKKAAEIIRDFIDREQISVIIRSDAPIGIGEASVIRGLRGEVRYRYKIINGACVVIPIKNLAALIRRPFITEIWPNPQGKLALDKSVPQIGADKVHKIPPSGLGVTGEGVRVAVVDGGIDNSHSEFQEGTANRIIAGRGRIQIGRKGINQLSAEKHGTHVAGIIGAADDGTGVTGVAPRVQFLDARLAFVFSFDDLFTDGDTNYGDATDAIEWAVANNADVINMSMGWAPWQLGREGTDPMSELIDRIVDGGIVFVVSAGNSAKKRASGDVTSQKRTDTISIEVPWDFGLETITVTLVWDPESPNNDLDLVILDSSNNNEVASSRSASARSVTHGTAIYEQVKVRNRGRKSTKNYDIRVEARNIQDKQDYEVWVSGQDFTFSRPEASYVDGTVLVPGYSEKVITVGAVDSSGARSLTSAWGPSQTNLIKPEIVAPGEDINSTKNGGDYVEDSGTSMAAPHVAGVAALILDAVGKNDDGEWNFSPHAVKAAIVHGAETGGPIPTIPNNGHGAGRVKADNIIFGGTVPPDGKQRFAIKPEIPGSSFGGNVLAASTDLTVAISWQNAAHNLDLVLIDARTDGKIQVPNSAGSNYEKVGPLRDPGDSYYLDVINRSDVPVAFTGAATYPIHPRPSVDLVVESLSVDPTATLAPTAASKNPGERFKLSATVRNLGMEAAHSTNVRYYRSSDAVGYTKVGDTGVKSLNPGLASHKIINLEAPEEPGTYYYRACVESVHGEIDTENNCSGTVRIIVGTAQVPDLVVESPSVDKRVLNPGERFKLSATV